MRKQIIEVFNAMNCTEFKSLEEIKRNYPEVEILDSWLMEEGIYGYANKIMEVLKLIRFGEKTERERKITETSAIMMQFYYDMVDEGIVYPLSSDEVNSVVLAQEISDMAIDFENGKYEESDWLEEVETYVRDRFIWSEYAIKEEE